MTNVTWDSGYQTGITLSGLIATATAAGGVRAISGQASGKYYFEITINTLSGLTSIGLLPSSVPNNSSGTGLQTTGYAGLRVGNNQTYINGTLVGTSLGTAAAGTVVCLAVDFDNQRIWCRYGAAGNWNGSASNSPTVPSTGASFAAFAHIGVSLLPFVAFSGAGGKVTANFGDTAFTGAVPAGFTSGVPTGGATNALFTQIGAEAWVNNPSVARITQVGAEVWVNNPSAARVTQIGVEVWQSTAGAVAPAPGALTFTGFAPILPVFATPDAGAINFTGFAPTSDLTSAPGVGAALFTGFAPTVGLASAPPSGALTFTGFVPSSVLTSALSAGALVFTGFAPHAVGNIRSDTAAGAMQFTGFAPVSTAQGKSQFFFRSVF